MDRSMFTRAATVLLLLPVFILSGCTASLTIKKTAGQPLTGTITIKTVIDPPAYELATLDTSKALEVLTTQNLQVLNTSGSLLIKVRDTATQQVLGQSQFGYNVVNGVLYAANPTAVHNWLSTFIQYGSEDVETTITVADITTKPTITQGTTTLAATAQYEGHTYASGSMIEQIGSSKIHRTSLSVNN